MEQLLCEKQTVTIEALCHPNRLLRNPEQIPQLLKQAQKTHGKLTHARGGYCFISDECPIFFVCMGCAPKAPDAAQYVEVEET